MRTWILVLCLGSAGCVGEITPPPLVLDAGIRDASTTDAGLVDAGETDAGSTDGG